MELSRTARWIELGLLFGVVPALLAAHARALALPFLFVTAWICLVVLWRDPTFQRDQLWRRERLWTWLRGPLAVALAACSVLAVGLYLLEPGIRVWRRSREHQGNGQGDHVGER